MAEYYLVFYFDIQMQAFGYNLFQQMPNIIHYINWALFRIEKINTKLTMQRKRRTRELSFHWVQQNNTHKTMVFVFIFAVDSLPFPVAEANKCVWEQSTFHDKLWFFCCFSHRTEKALKICSVLFSLRFIRI